MKTRATAASDSQPSPAPSPLVRRLVSAVLLWHCAAVLAGVFGTPPFSALEQRVKEFFLPYHELIDQGYSYRYFAPEPPPTPVLTAKLFDKDGRELETVRVPERGVEPRLRYQRQLAVATALAVSADQARNSPDRPPPFWGKSFANQIGRRNPACARVKLYQEVHYIPDMEQIRRALHDSRRPPDLDATEFYSAPELIGDYPCDPSDS